ncbi:DUF6345 domain-containing protein [Hyalangium gracile]|uniref:DUF6345 domain-containing protein n=1 Tax=Hyalangium gracile TaxID=394092 RepID=UPI001CCA3B6A|nr:DUF6345 domain-containing protein [Hyalangium gracile]
MDKPSRQPISETKQPSLDLTTQQLLQRVEEEETQATTQLSVVLQPEQVGNPFSQEVLSARAFSEDYYGAFSVEQFASASPLSYTHDDAQGWLAYVEQFKPRNFWYQDSGVGVWAYYEDYDNWQDTYGMDAVMAVYHSGHGSMDGNGVFYAAMGSNWAGQGTSAESSRMALGNEQVRYIFWSTCYSCRVRNGHNPMRTWHPANLGFRMLFGYETVSVDAPNYGSAFWRHWNTGKSFSRAFLDASWYDISTHQSPAVVACGQDQADARNRLYNERHFSFDAVPRNWYAWTWYNPASSAAGVRAPSLRLPERIVTVQFAPNAASMSRARSLLARLPLAMRLPREVAAGPDGTILHLEGDRRMALMQDGTYEIQFAQPNRDSRNTPSLATLLRTAQDFLIQAGLNREELAFDRIIHRYECSGSPQGSGILETPRIVETTIRFTQSIDGVPVVAPGLGSVAVTIDNDLNITSLVDRTRPVARAAERISMEPPIPGGNARAEGVSAGSLPEPEDLLQAAWQKKMQQWLLRGPMPRSFAVVPGSAEVGYAIRGNTGILVARQEVEVDCGNNFFKRFVVEEPILP